MKRATSQPEGDLVRVRISTVAHPRLSWAEGLRVVVPRGLLAAAGLDARTGNEAPLAIPAALPTLDARHARELRERAAFTERPPRSSRLPVNYHRVPGWVRAVAASAIGRWNRRSIDRWASFPQWPLDLSADFASDLAGSAPSPFALGKTPVWLSHDLDSPEGVRNLVTRFLPLEEAAGARSTSFIVPCAWPIDHARLSEVRARGHEIGVHGYDHANRTPFAGEAERRQRLDAARPFGQRYDAVGYRAPSLLRTRLLLRDLGARYQYDSSVPTSGGLFPVPNNGCASARPFPIEGVMEIPITLPRDGSLRFLGHSPDEIAQLWIDCAETIARSGGVVVLLTHCEDRFSGTPRMVGAYRRFLDHVASSDRFGWSMPRAILAQAALPA